MRKPPRVIDYSSDNIPSPKSHKKYVYLTVAFLAGGLFIFLMIYFLHDSTGNNNDNTSNLNGTNGTNSTPSPTTTQFIDKTTTEPEAMAVFGFEDSAGPTIAQIGNISLSNFIANVINGVIKQYYLSELDNTKIIDDQGAEVTGGSFIKLSPGDMLTHVLKPETIVNATAKGSMSIFAEIELGNGDLNPSDSFDCDLDFSTNQPSQFSCS